MPFTQLPLLPLLQVLDNLENDDRLHLSFCSQRMTELVKTFNRTAVQSEPKITIEKFGRSLGRITVSVKEWEYLVYVRLTSEVPKRTHSQFLGCRMVIDRNVRRSECDVLCTTEQEASALLGLIYSHLLNLFPRPPVRKLMLSPSDVLPHPFWKIGKEVETVKVVFPWRGEGRKTLSVLDIEFLLEKVTTEHLDIQVEIQKAHQLTSIPIGFQAKKVSISHAPWVALEAVLNSESEEIHLAYCREFKHSELINLLKLWMAGEKMVNLKKLTLKMDVQLAKRKSYWTAPMLKRFCEEFKLPANIETVRSPWTSAYPKIESDICRVDGRRAKIELMKFSFHLECV